MLVTVKAWCRGNYGFEQSRVRGRSNTKNTNGLFFTSVNIVIMHYHIINVFGFMQWGNYKPSRKKKQTLMLIQTESTELLGLKFLHALTDYIFLEL